MTPLRGAETGAIGITASPAGFQGWLLRRTTGLEQAMLVVAGLALVDPRPLFDAIGVGPFAIVLVRQYLRRAAPAHLPA